MLRISSQSQQLLVAIEVAEVSMGHHDRRRRSDSFLIQGVRRLTIRVNSIAMTAKLRTSVPALRMRSCLTNIGMKS